jgi:hypothetical protein
VEIRAILGMQDMPELLPDPLSIYLLAYFGQQMEIIPVEFQDQELLELQDMLVPVEPLEMVLHHMEVVVIMQVQVAFLGVVPEVMEQEQEQQALVTDLQVKCLFGGIKEALVV